MRILLLLALLIPAGLAEGTQTEDEMGTPNINTIIEWVRSEYPDLPRIQTTNCRKISGSSSWSQHSWANAADIFVSKAVGDELYPRLKEEFGTHIKTILWQVRDHFDHIHVDTWPTGIGTPPCGGGTLRVQHKDGTQGIAFTDDIEGGEEDMALTPDDLNKIADAVWYRLITHPVTGQQRGAQALLADAVKYAANAASKPASSGATADQVADKLSQRLAS